MPYWSEWISYVGPGCPVPDHTFMRVMLCHSDGGIQYMEGTADAKGSHWCNADGVPKVHCYQYLKWKAATEMIERAKKGVAIEFGNGDTGPQIGKTWRNKYFGKSKWKRKGGEEEV